jgi:hypothetical protein
LVLITPSFQRVKSGGPNRSVGQIRGGNVKTAKELSPLSNQSDVHPSAGANNLTQGGFTDIKIVPDARNAHADPANGGQIFARF